MQSTTLARFLGDLESWQRSSPFKRSKLRCHMRHQISADVVCAGEIPPRAGLSFDITRTMR